MVPTSSNKRRYSGGLPTPKDIAKIFKKPRRDHPELLETYASPNYIGAPPVPPVSSNMSSIAHSVPHTAVPILVPPYRVSDFFTDYKSKFSKETQRQFSDSVMCYPPPRAPFLSPGESTQPGVMVPFVFPQFPAIQYDPLTSMSEWPRGGSTSKSKEPSYPVMAPLPFPPPNYMPYPLISEKAPPTPHEVFETWLDASQHLPRVDMVVASAAGSICDLHTQASASGLSVSKLQEMVRLGQLAESDPEGYDEKSDFSDSSDTSESSYRNFMDYYENIDVTSECDAYAVVSPPPKNLVVVESVLRNDYTKVNVPVVESGEVLQAEPTSYPQALTMKMDDSGEPRPPSPSLLAPDEDVADATGKSKEERRLKLVERMRKLDAHFQENREQYCASRKRQLLDRLHQLRTSHIHFETCRNKINDEELRRYAQRRQAQNDEELLTLRLSSNYEKLKTVLNFYQTSYRSYKTMNVVMINKLQKMKNFLEYQKQVLDDHVKGSNDPDAINIRNRDIAKLYDGFVEQDYSNEIKEVFRAAIAKDDGMEKEDPYTLDPSLFRKVYTGHQHTATVHDFMPLVTKDEFRLVTGEAPSKVGPSKDPNSKGKGGRHQIFQSSLYDRVTSGSDTNASDSGVPVKRRPGRRAAPKPTYGEEVAKHNNDTALVAKIMKQFIGPAAASPQELTEDLSLLGIQTKWPIK